MNPCRPARTGPRVACRPGTPLGLHAAAATGIERATAAALDALRKGEPYRRWLLIFDNADQPEDLNDLIPRGPGDVLITSRNHRWDAVVHTEQVNVFLRPESTEFLTKRIPKGVAEPDVSRLAEALTSWRWRWSRRARRWPRPGCRSMNTCGSCGNTCWNYWSRASRRSIRCP